MRLTNFLLLSPGGENDAEKPGSNIDDAAPNEQSLDMEAEVKEQKPFSQKVREALQDWSNDDQKDQEIDDSTP